MLARRFACNRSVLITMEHCQATLVLFIETARHLVHRLRCNFYTYNSLHMFQTLHDDRVSRHG